MLSLQNLFVISLNLYLSGALPQNHTSELAIRLASGAVPSSMPLMANGFSSGGSKQAGMGMPQPSGVYYGGGSSAKGAAAGSAQATSAAKGSSSGSSISISSSSSSASSNTTTESGVSPAENGNSPAQAPPNAGADIPSPVIDTNPSYTLPALLQNGSSTSSTEGNPKVAGSGSTGENPKEGTAENVSQAETSDSKKSTSVGSVSYSNPYASKGRVIVGTVLSTLLILSL